MSLFGAIGGLLKGAWGGLTSVLGGAGRVAGTVLGMGGGAPAQPPVVYMPPSGGVRPTGMPAVMPGGGVPSPGISSTGGFSRWLGTQAGSMISGATGIGVRGLHRGKLTGNMIPRGFEERMSKNGVIYLSKRTRGRGLSSRDIRSFYRVNRLVKAVMARTARPHPTYHYPRRKTA